MKEARTFAERSAALSECGRRKVNQDAVLMTELPGGAELVAVADGMGGHAAGEVASQRALEVLRAALAGGSDLTAAVRAANAAILAEAAAHPEYEGMGTTLVALLRHDNQYTIANVGDSRAYRIDGRGVRQLTEDHSFVAEASRSGMPAEEIQKSRWRHAVTRALGTEPQVDVDCYGPFDTREPHAIVLCTDGLHRVLSEPKLQEVVLHATQLDEAVRCLTSCALDAGSDDNISVALVQFGMNHGAAHDGAAHDIAAHDIAARNGAAQDIAAHNDAAHESAIAATAAATQAARSAIEAPARSRARHRRTRHHHRWNMTQSLIIVFAFIAVIMFVGMLALAL